MRTKEMSTLVFHNKAYEIVDKTSRENIEVMKTDIHELQDVTLATDDTLTKENKPADAKATGDAIDELSASTSASIKNLNESLDNLSNAINGLEVLVGNEITEQIAIVNKQIEEVKTKLATTTESGMMSAVDKEFLDLLRSTFRITDDSIDIGGKYIDNAAFR